MRPAPSSEGDPSLSDIAVRVTSEVSITAAAAAKAGGGDGAAAAAAGALLDYSAVEDQVRCFAVGS